jgi:hypothetical protein
MSTLCMYLSISALLYSASTFRTLVLCFRRYRLVITPRFDARWSTIPNKDCNGVLRNESTAE